MNRRTKEALASLVAVLAMTHWLSGCNSSDCAIECPAGTVPDSTGCSCVQGGPSCNPMGAEPVQDGGAILGNCCPHDVLQSTSREPPSGACTGSFQCFVAVHQVCSGSVGPVDEYACTCSGSAWQCSLSSAGAGACPPTDAGAGSD